MKYCLTDHQINNLMVFLDRVEVKGLTEIHAMNEILIALKNPCVEKIEE